MAAADSDSDSSFYGFTASDCDDFLVSDSERDFGSDNSSDSDENEPLSSHRISRVIATNAEDWQKVDNLENDSFDQGTTGVPVFDQPYGPVDIPDVTEPADYLLLLLGVDFLEELVTETNKYGDIKAAEKNEAGKPFSRFQKWRHVTVQEMKAFLGLVINMGLIGKSCLNEYWSNKLSQQTPYFMKVFTRDRFLLILSVFHNRESDVPSPARSHKVNYFIETFMQSSRRYYRPRKEISIDESLIGFQGRAQAMQYMPNKHHKFGLKLWNLCESETGYTLNAFLYPGKQGPVSPNGLGYDVCMKLKLPYVECGHHLYVDNFFSSVPLAMDLLDKSTYLTGTFRSNRKHIPAIVKVKQKKGEITAVRKGPLLCVNWHDKKPVFILSTNDTSKPVTYVSKRGREHQGVPHLITSYNQYMGGVDMSDMRSYKFLDERRTVKWNNKVFFFMLGRLMLNAFLIYSQHVSGELQTKKLTRRQFIVSVVEGLVGDFREERARLGRPMLSAEARLVNSREHLEMRKLPNQKLRDCAVCSRRGVKRVRSAYECVTCDLGLCIEPCWKLYHTRKVLRPVNED